MKIVHVSSVRRLSAGQRKQLNYEHQAAKTLDEVVWQVLAFHDHEPVFEFERQVPAFFRRVFLRNLYLWLYLVRNRKSYDFVLLRYMTFDPFMMIFGWLVPCRASVHHAKEIRELKIIRPGWKGLAASLLERLCGRINALQVVAFVAVTKDIARYQESLSPRVRCSFVYPNAVLFNEMDLLADTRRSQEVVAAFLCGRFSPWHGLDLLLDSLEFGAITDDARLKIYLAGEMPGDLFARVVALDRPGVDIVALGFLSEDKYLELLGECDFGLASFAMYREGLSEGATLKVRDYLSRGLPVFSGHKDTALPEDFPFYKIGVPTADEMYQFGRSMKRKGRAEVRNESAPFLDKREAMQSVSDWVKGLV